MSKSGKTQLDVLISQGMSWWQKTPTVSNSYTAHRHRFMLNRLRLQAQITLIVCLTLIAFFVYANVPLKGKIAVLQIGGAVELATFIFWTLCKNTVGRRYPHLIFLGLSWSVTCIQQIGVACFNYVDPETDIWTLMFLTQATLIPVLWHLHLISQIGTLVCYFSLYAVLHPTLKFPALYYAEEGLYLFWTCLICNLSVYLYERLQKGEFNARKELELARQKSDKLLLNILPEPIAERLKQQTTTIADSFNEVTVLFADIVGFTELATQISAAELVELLNKIFSLFDQLAERHKVEKIKTIGDAYMVVAGLPEESSDHALAIANMALDMQQAIVQFNQENNQSFRIRIGISTGPVVAGVIGLKKFAYDLWGDTVNTASRMESQSIADCIQVCEATYERLKDNYLLEQRGVIQVKGKGEMTTYLLKGLIVHN